MEFGCSICEYTSSQKEHVINHINRKKSCGPGEKTVIEIPIDIICEYCKKNFSSIRNLERHMKNICRHKHNIMLKEIRDLKEKVKKLEQDKNTIINQTNNNNNNNTFNIFIVNNYEDTSLEKLTDKTYNKILSETEEVYQIIPRLIKEIHFNPDIPENHNIVLSNRNKNNRHLQVYRNKHWEIEKKDTEIDNLISDKENNLSDWVAEKGGKYPAAQEKFTEYLDQKYDEDVSKLVKDEVELVLYNNKHLIKTT